MRRYRVTEAPLTVLLTDLAEHIAGAEHLHPEDPSRAEAYRRARAELEAGAVEAWARSRKFRVAEVADSYGVTEGTRAELAAVLDEYGASRAKAGNTDKARAIAEALIDLTERGQDGVTYEDITYLVVEE